MKKKAAPSSMDLKEVDDLILKVLARNPLGLSINKIRKNLPPSYRIPNEQMVARLNHLLSEGHIHAWHPPAGKAKKPPAPIYSLEPLGQLISHEIEKILKGGPLTPAEIKKRIPGSVGKYLLILLDPLIKDGKVKWHPPLKGKRLGLETPDPADFLSGEIKRLFEKGDKLGFESGAVLQAVQSYIKPLPARKQPFLTPENTERIVFQAMKDLKPAAAQGALVYIPDLREALRDTFSEKESFDQAILNLATREKVQLQSHSLPAELTEEQREAMIDNRRGSYFMAIGIRME
jgi:hypothetical protein